MYFLSIQMSLKNYFIPCHRKYSGQNYKCSIREALKQCPYFWLLFNVFFSFLLCLFQGGEVIFITYSDDFPLPDNGEFFLVFEGKSQRHVTTTQQINAYTLRAVVPGKK